VDASSKCNTVHFLVASNSFRAPDAEQQVQKTRAFLK
jgi:hypothetical protein